MNVLIINHQNQIQNNLIDLFRKTRHCSYMAVTSIEDAVNAIETGLFDLIISDPRMLDFSDAKISILIHRKMGSKPILYFNDRGSFQTALEYMDTGNDEFYMSAFPSEYLEKRILAYVKSQKVSGINLPEN